MTDIKSIPLERLRELPFLEHEPDYRLRQLFHWLHKHDARSFDDMTNLPRALRETLAANCTITQLRAVRHLESPTDGTQKFLYELSDGHTIETVLMRYKHGVSACLSTQVGCVMGCKFCASTKAGFVRNLTASEMLCEITQSERETGLTIGSVVLMGIGEPFLNFQNTLDFLRLLSHKEGRGFSLRHVSLSTCGLVPEIKKLEAEHLGLTLSISLHAPDDETRDRIMPVNKQYPVAELVAASKHYAQETGRRVSYEYALIDGINDSDGQARKLARLLRGSLCHVNLIPLNEVSDTGLRGSSPERVRSFLQTLEREGINATVRRTLGADVMAACGQLRVQTLDK